MPVYARHGAFIVSSAGKDRMMSYVKRSLEELNLMDDFLMGQLRRMSGTERNSAVLY